MSWRDCERTLGLYEATYHDNELDALPSESSTVAVGLRRVTVSPGAMQTIADAEESPNLVDDSFIGELWRGDLVQ